MIITIWGLRNELMCMDSTLDKFLDELDKYEPTQSREVHIEDIAKSIVKCSMLDNEGLFDSFLDLIDRQINIKSPLYLRGFIHQDKELVINKLNPVDKLYFFEGYMNLSLRLLEQYPDNLSWVSGQGETLFPSVVEMIKKMKNYTNKPSGLEDKSKIKGVC
jgi:hypothetical protein